MTSSNIFKVIADDVFADMDEFKKLLAIDSVVRSHDDLLLTPLHAVASTGNLRMLRPLVERFRQLGLNVDDQENKARRTPLHNATCAGCVEAVVVLVEDGGAQPKQRDAVGLDGAHLAAQNNQPLLLFYFLQLGVPRASLDYDAKTPLHWAAQQDASWCITLLLVQGADINALDTSKSTPLHYAARQGHDEAVRLLVEAGAALELRDSDGNRPQDVAKSRKPIQTYLETATRRGRHRVAPNLTQAPKARAALLTLPSLLIPLGCYVLARFGFFSWQAFLFELLVIAGLARIQQVTVSTSTCFVFSVSFSESLANGNNAALVHLARSRSEIAVPGRYHDCGDHLSERAARDVSHASHAGTALSTRRTRPHRSQE